jgi:hypothetical protein
MSPYLQQGKNQSNFTTFDMCLIVALDSIFAGNDSVAAEQL